MTIIERDAATINSVIVRVGEEKLSVPIPMPEGVLHSLRLAQFRALPTDQMLHQDRRGMRPADRKR